MHRSFSSDSADVEDCIPLGCQRRAGTESQNQSRIRRRQGLTGKVTTLQCRSRRHAPRSLVSWPSVSSLSPPP
jgi:hypothetical protein